MSDHAMEAAERCEYEVMRNDNDTLPDADTFEPIIQSAIDSATADLRTANTRLRSQLDGVQGALADAGDVLAMREDGDYGASVRQVVEQRDEANKRAEDWQRLAVLAGSVLESLRASEGDGTALCDEIKAAIVEATDAIREAALRAAGEGRANG